MPSQKGDLSKISFAYFRDFFSFEPVTENPSDAFSNQITAPEHAYEGIVGTNVKFKKSYVLPTTSAASEPVGVHLTVGVSRQQHYHT